MKKLLSSLVLVLLPLEAGAVTRYNPTTLSCAEVQRIGQSEGAAIMRWSSPRNPGLPLFVRIVKGRFQCDHHEFAGPGYVPTQDNANCPVVECRSRQQYLEGSF